MRKLWLLDPFPLFPYHTQGFSNPLGKLKTWLLFHFVLQKRGEDTSEKKEIRFQAYYCTLHEKDLKEMNVPWAVTTTATASLELLSPLMLDHR